MAERKSQVRMFLFCFFFFFFIYIYSFYNVKFSKIGAQKKKEQKRTKDKHNNHIIQNFKIKISQLLMCYCLGVLFYTINRGDVGSRKQRGRRIPVHLPPPLLPPFPHFEKSVDVELCSAAPLCLENLYKNLNY